MTTKIFIVLSVLTLSLFGTAAYRDQSTRVYLDIQQQYMAQHANDHQPPSKIQYGVQQLFPTFALAKIGDTPKVERCISCHVPDIGQIGPQFAANNIVTDFYKYEPNATNLAQEYHLTHVHPAIISRAYYDQFGAGASLTFTNVKNPAITNKQNPNGVPQTVQLPGYLPSFLDPANTDANGCGGSPCGIDQIGCVVCHNGNRLALTEAEAHTNLIVNPEYSWSQGAVLYYQYCVSCHGVSGEGAIGPALNNQDRLGFYNEDYYYRCIDWGFTDFEHYGSAMPNWSGGVAAGYPGDVASGAKKPKPAGVMSSDATQNQYDIDLMVQFIRHWQNYQTLP